MDRLKSQEAENQKEQRVVIIMGSESDLEHTQKIVKVLDIFEVKHAVRVASAHKTPRYLGEILDDYNSQNDTQTVFIAVAGRSNALGGYIDFQTMSPVISAPPYSDKYGGGDIYSSLRMPSGSAAVTAVEPEMAAFHAVKILSLNNKILANRYLQFQKELQEKIYQADSNLNSTVAPLT